MDNKKVRTEAVKAFEQYDKAETEKSPFINGFIRGAIWRDKELAESLVLEGYVARDKDGTLIIGRKEPKRVHQVGAWMGFGQCMHLDKELFKDVTWETGPVKVEFTIRKVD